MKVLEARWSAKEEGGSIAFENVVLDEDVRGIRIWYKTFGNDAFEMELWADGALTGLSPWPERLILMKWKVSGHRSRLWAQEPILWHFPVKRAVILIVLN